MSETLVTLVGNAATHPDYRETASGVAVARFRLAVTARRWDRGQTAWTDAHTSFYTVSAWRGLAQNVIASVSVGDPLLVRGRLRVQEQEREGRRWTTADIDAVAVGHDLTRGTSAFRRVRQLPRPSGAAGPAGGGGGSAPERAPAGEGDAAGGQRRSGGPREGSSSGGVGLTGGSGRRCPTREPRPTVVQTALPVAR